MRTWLSSALVLLTACGGGGAPTRGVDIATAWELAGPRELTSRRGHYRVRWQPIPDPPPFNEPFDLDVTCTQIHDDAPIGDDVYVTLTMRMPQHSHGMATTPVLTRPALGVLRYSGMQLHMQGDWELRMRISDGGRHDEVVFPLTMR